MSSSHYANFNDRRDAAAKAKSAMLQKFQARPAPDDPSVMEREAARRAVQEARDARLAERKLAKEAEARRLAAEEAARVAAEKARLAEEAAKAEVLRREQKAARDARYAARKARR